MESRGRSTSPLRSSDLSKCNSPKEAGADDYEISSRIDVLSNSLPTGLPGVVRPASEPELESPFAHMTFEELKAELLAGFASLFPELRVVPAQRQALIAGTRDR